jgi:hypothetical protein
LGWEESGMKGWMYLHLLVRNDIMFSDVTTQRNDSDVMMMMMMMMTMTVMIMMTMMIAILSMM